MAPPGVVGGMNSFTTASTVEVGGSWDTGEWSVGMRVS
jgi:hypothetical protein